MLATGKTNGKVPYTAVAKNLEVFIDSVTMPQGIIFKDPSRYKVEETAKILALWRARQKERLIPFWFDSVISDGTALSSEYAEGMFDGWAKPQSNKMMKPKVAILVALVTALPGENKECAESQDSSDDSTCDNSTDGAEETVAPEGAEHPMSPPPTEMSEDDVTPNQPRRRPITKVVMSDEEGSAGPTVSPQIITPTLRPIEEEGNSDERSLPKRHRGPPKQTPTQGTPYVLLPARPRRFPRQRQLATPGPSDSATATGSDTGTLPATEVRKSSRLRRQK